jgi:hypothetical protein
MEIITARHVIQSGLHLRIERFAQGFWSIKTYFFCLSR